MRVLVCGGRDFSDKGRVYNFLDKLNEQTTITQIIEGGATGADYLAKSWAVERGVVVRTFYADWKMYGRAAGPIRNKQMINEGDPTIVVAFPGGSGTKNMIKQANNYDIVVVYG